MCPGLGVTSSDSQVLIAGSNFYALVYPAQDLSTGRAARRIPSHLPLLPPACTAP